LTASVNSQNFTPEARNQFLALQGTDTDLKTLKIVLTLANDQIEAQLFYFIIRLLQSSTCFEHRRVHHQEVKLY